MIYFALVAILRAAAAALACFALLRCPPPPLCCLAAIARFLRGFAFCRLQFGKSSSLNYRGGAQIVVNKADTYLQAQVSADKAKLGSAGVFGGPSPILAWAAEPMPTKAPPEVEITPAWVTLNQKVILQPTAYQNCSMHLARV